MKRVIGLDVGDRTIGVAVSDGLNLTAQPVITIRRQSYAKDFSALKEYVEEYEVGEIVVGLPKNMDGTLGPQSGKVLAFVEKMKEEIPLPVELYDERLSTAMALKALIRADVSRAKRKKIIDKMAAQVILQGYLDRKRARPGP